MPFPSLHNENELLLQAAEGSKNAFRQLFEHYWDKIFSVAFVFTKSTLLSEEIVQDVFLKIWLKRDQLSAIKKFDAYLFIIARNHIYNELRKKSRETPFVTDLQSYFVETSGLPEQSLILKETTHIVEKAVKLLPGQQRAVFELSRNEGLEYAQIADRLGISKLTVRSHMKKALQFIRQYLKVNNGEVIVMVCMHKLLSWLSC